MVWRGDTEVGLGGLALFQILRWMVARFLASSFSGHDAPTDPRGIRLLCL
jgi:hypothetical protein